MAVLIRSAQISSEAVTLDINEHAKRRANGLATLPINTHGSEARPNVIKKETQTPSPDKADEASLTEKVNFSSSFMDKTERERKFELDAREKNLLDREKRLQKNLETEKKKVLAEAYAAGYKIGEAAAEKSFSERLELLRKLIESLKEEVSQEITGLEDIVVGIAFESVCKILGKSLVNEKGILAVVQQVMSHAKDQEDLIIHVSPSDYALLYENKGALSGDSHHGKHELVPDDRVALGGCLVETSGGTLDGRLEIQLQQLRDTLISARKMLPE